MKRRKKKQENRLREETKHEEWQHQQKADMGTNLKATKTSRNLEKENFKLNKIEGGRDKLCI